MNPNKPPKARISRVTTRTGDTGESGLADGTRLPKDDAIFEAMGAVDELNAAIGFLSSLTTHYGQASTNSLLQEIQHILFELGAELALIKAQPEHKHRLQQEDVNSLETASSQLNQALPPLEEFVLPKGNQPTSWCHYTRTLARKTERRLVTLNQEHAINPFSLQYINRLSDYFFILARTLKQEQPQQEQETCWNNRRSPE